MKMTMHIDEELLTRVIKSTGAASKTEAVRMALLEMDRKARLAEFGKTGLGLSIADMRAAMAPDYEEVSLRLAEEPAVYTSGKSPILPTSR